MNVSLSAALIAGLVPLIAYSQTLETATFVVLGDGLAAGEANFGLIDVNQQYSFPAQIAARIPTAFPQPAVQGPGLANPPGMPPLPIRLPGYPQTTVRTPSPPTVFVFNLSVPGFKLADAVSRRPTLPLIWQRDMLQTTTNMILGFPGGPAQFEKESTGETVFRFQGGVQLDFAGFLYPAPDLAPGHGYLALPGSYLDIFLYLQAMHVPETPEGVMTGGASNVQASTGQMFSYNYSIPCNPTGPSGSFQYTNQTLGASFRMHNLGSATCANSRTSTLPSGSYDTVTFSGFGTWSLDSDTHLATVQVSTSPDLPYVSILIDGGQLSNVNTKPAARQIP